LFENIIKDLFPGIQKPDVDYGKLHTSILEVCTEMNIQPVEITLMKIFQL